MDAFPIIYFALGFACAGYASRTADSKGYSFWWWFAGGFFFNIIALIAISGIADLRIQKSLERMAGRVS